MLALSLYCRGEETVKKKRGIFGEGIHGAHGLLGHSHLALGGPVDLGHHLDLGHSSLSLGHASFHGNYGYGSGHGGITLGHRNGLSYGNSYGAGYGYNGAFDLGSYVHKHITVTNKIGVPFPQPYPVHITKDVPVPIPHPVPVPVDTPYAVHIPQPYPVPVEKPVPYTVVNPIPYPVQVPYKVPINIPVPVHQPAVVQNQVTQNVPATNRPVISIGSGSLGVVRLPNGNYALGSGSLGYTSATGSRVNFVNNANTVSQGISLGPSNFGSNFGFGGFNQNFAGFGNPVHAGYEKLGKALSFGHENQL